MNLFVLILSIIIGCGKKSLKPSTSEVNDPPANNEKSVIDRIIKENTNEIQSCYQQQLAIDSTLEGNVKYKIVIAKDGSVKSVDLEEGTLSSLPVEECVHKQLLKLQFPKPSRGGIIILRRTFTFPNPSE